MRQWTFSPCTGAQPNYPLRYPAALPYFSTLHSIWPPSNHASNLPAMCFPLY